jgi:hypothetical protein
MQKTISILFGLGLLVLAGNLMFPLIGFNLFWWDAWRFWPVLLLGAGLFLAAIPFLAPAHRGLGALFIPAFPLLTTGSILFLASLFNIWEIWSLLWPLEILSVAAGFFFAALYARSVWLSIPAILVGANGLVLAFCNLTGLWHWWVVLWTVEPLAVGVSLLLVGLKTRTRALNVVGLLFCMFAGAMATMMSAILFSTWRLFNLFWPSALIFTGVILLFLGLGRNLIAPQDTSTAAIADSPAAPVPGS